MTLPSAVMLVSVGNTRTRFALGENGQLEPSRVLENADLAGLAEAIGADADRGDAAAVAIASVNNPIADKLESALAALGSIPVKRFGRDIPIQIDDTLTDRSTVGQDRLLNAMGAFVRSQQACIVIDAGTAVTVDFVDGEGIFHGGAIAPGVHMMRDALHEKTAALPKAEISTKQLHAEGEPPFGKNTVEAINLGVTASIIGLAHVLIDRYAQFYEAYPRVVATGGDAPLLFQNDELVEHIVPDLTLIGMLGAWELAQDGADAEDASP